MISQKYCYLFLLDKQNLSQNTWFIKEKKHIILKELYFPFLLLKRCVLKFQYKEIDNQSLAFYV